MPVDDSVTARSTVAHVVEHAREALENDDCDRVALHFVAEQPDQAAESRGEGEQLLERVEAWIDEDFGEDIPDAISVETALFGEDSYLFSPADYAEVILEYARAEDIDVIILDPEFNPAGTTPLLQPLAAELARSDVEVREAPVERPARTAAITRAASLSKYGAVFLSAFGFYLALGSLKLFDLVTGAVSAGVVSLVLAPVVFRGDPGVGQTLKQLARLVPYSAYLLWEIAKANLAIAYVVLHPSLPIDPKVIEVRSAVWGDVPITTLANSITLTPGTLSMTVSKRTVRIHSLTHSAREGILDGALERAVRFVFYGREGSRIPSPREREDVTEVHYGSDDPDQRAEGVADD